MPNSHDQPGLEHISPPNSFFQRTCTFQADFGSTKIEPTFVKASSPDLNEKSLITIFVSETGDDLKDLFCLLSAFFRFGADLFDKYETDSLPNLLSEIQPRLGTCTLHQCDGELRQYWNFRGVWPHSVNFGELCYSSDPTVEIEVTWRFQEYTEGYAAQPTIVLD